MKISQENLRKKVAELFIFFDIIIHLDLYSQLNKLAHNWSN